MILGSARQAIHDAYATDLTSPGLQVSLREPAKKPDFTGFLENAHRCSEETREALLAEYNPVGFYAEDRVGKDSTDSRICHTAEAGMIISVVEGLGEPFSSWAKWAYGPRTRDFMPEQYRLFRWLDRDVSENFASIDRDYRKATVAKIRDVVAYSILDYRSYVISEQHLYPVSLIINRCGIVRQNWRRDFQPWHRYYWGLCDTYLDRTSLPPVAEAVSRLKGSDDY
jgi:hypothetical protein